MDTLKIFDVLPSEVVVYVPGTCGANTQADTSQYVGLTQELLAKLFGGATTTAAIGSWISDIHGHVKEHTTLVYASTTPEMLNRHIHDVIDWCIEMMYRLEQECMSLKVDGRLYLIDTEKAAAYMRKSAVKVAA